MITEKELRQMIMKQCGGFSWYGEEQAEDARTVLHDVYMLLKAVRPSKLYDTDAFHSHFSYLHHLIAIRKALLEKRYSRAVNELGSFAYAQPILQRRIYYNLLSLLEECGGFNHVDFQTAKTGIGKKSEV